MTIPPEGLISAPLQVDIIVTGKCNLACPYCSNNEGNKKKDLSTKKWMDFFDELGELCIERVTLSGGEIFLRSDIFTLIDGIIKNKMRYSLYSNGTLITDEIITLLSEGKRKIRLDKIQISIDGSCAEVHNRSRPHDSFEKAIRSLKLLHNSGFPAVVRVTVNKYNMNDLPDIARFLLEDIGIKKISFMDTALIGRATQYEDNLVLSDSDFLQSLKVLQNLKLKYDDRLLLLGNFLGISYMADCSGDKKIGNNYSNGKPGFISACGAGYTRLAVLNDGTMVPCDRLSHMIVGVIGIHRLKDIWENSPSLNVARALYHFPLSSIPECNDCQFLEYCSGGCPGVVFENQNHLIGIDFKGCYKEFYKNL